MSYLPAGNHQAFPITCLRGGLFQCVPEGKCFTWPDDQRIQLPAGQLQVADLVVLQDLVLSGKLSVQRGIQWVFITCRKRLISEKELAHCP